jgi:hypothetical protein
MAPKGKKHLLLSEIKAFPSHVKNIDAFRSQRGLFKD